MPGWIIRCNLVVGRHVVTNWDLKLSSLWSVSPYPFIYLLSVSSAASSCRGKMRVIIGVPPPVPLLPNHYSRQPTLWLTPSTAENLPSPKLKLGLPPPELWWALAVSVNPGTEIHIWGGASNWHRTRKFFVDRECEEFIGCPPGRGIRAGISGSDRMLLGPKATEAASNKVNWGTHCLRWLLGMYFQPLFITNNHSLLLHTLFPYPCGVFSAKTSLCLVA